MKTGEHQLAVNVTTFLSTMWAFYLLTIFGLIPLLLPESEAQVLYWSNFMQLVFLPLITVGSAVLSKTTIARAKTDHHRLKKEFKFLKASHRDQIRILNGIALNTDELLNRTAPDQSHD